MNPPLVLIDTSAWIHVLGRNPAADLRERVSFLVLENLAAVTTPVVFELARGARTAQEADHLKTRLESLHPFPLTETDWTEAARWAMGMARKGVNAKSMDILIGYMAHRHGLTLLHVDQDFDRMASAAQLKVESWVGRVKASSSAR